MPLLLSLVVLIVFVLTIAVWRLLKQKFYLTQFSSIEAKQVPAPQIALLEKRLTLIQSVNLTSSSFITLNLLPDRVRYGALLKDHTSFTHGLLLLGIDPERPTHTSVTLSTRFTDGTSIRTTNLAVDTYLSRNPRVDVHVYQYASEAELLQKHTERIQEHLLRAKPLELEPSEALTALNQDSLDFFSFLNSKREVIWMEQTKSYRLSLYSALRVVIKSFASILRSRKYATPQGSRAPFSPEEIDLVVGEYFDSGVRENNCQTGHVLLGSIVILSLSFFGELLYLVPFVLILVIAIHETLHKQTAALLKLKGTSIPIASSISENISTRHLKQTTPFKELLLAISGPLPGVLLGYLIMLSVDDISAPHNKFYVLVALVLFIYNGFSLLPISPFNGGKLVSKLSLFRVPYSSVLCTAASVFFVLILSIVVQSSSLLLICIALVLSIPSRYRLEKLKHQLNKEISVGTVGTSAPTLSEKQLVHILFSRLQAPDFQKFSFSQQCVLIKDIMSIRETLGQPWLARGAAFLIYVGLVNFLMISVVYGLLVGQLIPEVIELEILREEDSRDRVLNYEKSYYASQPIVNDEKPNKAFTEGYICGETLTSKSERASSSSKIISNPKLKLAVRFPGVQSAGAFFNLLNRSLPESEQALRIGETIVLSSNEDMLLSMLADEGTAEVLGRELSKKQDRSFAPERTLSFSVSAVAPNEETAKHLVNQLGFFLEFNLGPFIYAPWLNYTLSPAEQKAAEAARYTYWLLNRFNEDISGHFLEYPYLVLNGWQSFWMMITDGHLFSESQIRRYQKDLEEIFLESLKQSEERGSTINQEIVDLYLSRERLYREHRMAQRSSPIFVDPNDSNRQGHAAKEISVRIKELDRAIARILLQRDTTRSEQIESYRFKTSGEVARWGTEVRLKVSWFNDIFYTLPELLTFLCNNNMTEISYTFSE